METSYLKTLELDKIIARASDGCVCKEAREQLLALEPQCDPDEVRYALEQTDAINSLLIKNGSPCFGGVEGVSSLAARAVKGGVLSMGELLMVAGALRNFQNLTSWYGSSEHDALPTDDLFYALAPQPGLEQQISSAILAPDAMADTASHTLNELRKKIRATENSIRDRLESMVRNMDTSKYLQESVVSMRNGRYVVPVKSEYRGEVSGIIHDVSSTGATVFVENIFDSRYRHVPELVRLGADIRTEGRVAVVCGAERLHGARVRAADLRGGAALVLAGLQAEGTTEVEQIHHIERGYADLVGDLRALGAEIRLREA